MKPNVLLVVFDTARADAFEPYGAPPSASPVVADLARRGVAHTAAVAPCSWTMPSHAAMFTGLLPRTIGLSTAPHGKPVGCRPVLEGLRDRFLPEVLRQQGWSTAGASTNPWIARHVGFATGFDTFVEVRSPRSHRIADGDLAATLIWSWEAFAARVDDGAREVEQVIDTWLARHDGSPFFWFVNLVECHSPYLPPKPWNDLGPIQRVRAGLEARRHLTLAAIWRAAAGDFDIPDEALARMRHLYGRAVRSMDAWLQRVLERLEDRGLLDDTLVIVTSDHGENLGENGLIGHSFSLDERLVRVPLVMAGPGAPPDRGPIGLTGVPALVAEAVGMHGHPWRELELPRGIAVSQLDAVVAPDDPRAEQCAREWRLEGRHVSGFTTPVTCATDGRLKLVVDAGVERLHDLALDPLEQVPVDPRSLDADGALALGRLRGALEDAARAEGTGIPTEAGGRTADDADEPDDLEDRLRLLGYL